VKQFENTFRIVKIPSQPDSLYRRFYFYFIPAGKKAEMGC